MSSKIKCEICDRDFSSERTLKLHQKTHINKEFKCSNCEQIYSSKQNFVRHTSSCNNTILVLKLKQKQEDGIKTKIELEQYQLQVQDQKQELAQLRIEYERKISEFETERRRSQQEVSRLQLELKKKNELCEDLQQEIKELHVKTLNIIQDNQTVLKHVNMNNNNKIYIQQNNIQNNCNGTGDIIPATNENIQHLLSTLNLMDGNIITEADFVDELVRKGVTKFYRVTDQARGIASWKEEEHSKLIKEKNGTNLARKLCDPEVMIRATTEIEQNLIPEQEFDEHINQRKQLSLYRNIGKREPTTIENIGKNLVKKGFSRSVTNESLQEDEKIQLINNPFLFYPERVTKFQSVLSKIIQKNPEQFLFCNPSNIGTWLGNHLSYYVIVSRNDQEQHYHYIEVNDDDDKLCRLFANDFVLCLKLVLIDQLLTEQGRMGDVFLQGIHKVITRKEGYVHLVPFDENPLDNLQTNIQWFGNLESDYKEKNEELFDMLLIGLN
jgi:hypothetical protein